MWHILNFFENCVIRKNLQKVQIQVSSTLCGNDFHCESLSKLDRVRLGKENS